MSLAPIQWLVHTTVLVDNNTQRVVEMLVDAVTKSDAERIAKEKVEGPTFGYKFLWCRAVPTPQQPARTTSPAPERLALPPPPPPKPKLPEFDLAYFTKVSTIMPPVQHGRISGVLK